MDSRQWTGDDTRDLDHDREADPCPECGADEDAPCATDCQCSWCLQARARLAALLLSPADSEA